MLSRETLKANIREDNERALASLKHQLHIATTSSAEDKMAKRYQMVRFVGTLAHLNWFDIRTTESNATVTTG